MIRFHRVSLQDQAWISRLIREENSRSADHCFSNIYMWDDTYRQEVASVCGCLGIRLGYAEQPFYAYPVGGGDVEQAIRALREDAKAHGVPLRLRGILRQHLPRLEQMFPGEFVVTDDRFVSDYLYPAEKLAALSGKKLQSKRNHINRFLDAHPDWCFQPVTEDNLNLCMEFQDSWLKTHTQEGQEDYTSENLALNRCFRHFSELGMEGGILLAGGSVVAYTLGEMLSTDTFDVHFEKADAEIPGAYAMVNREFVRDLLGRHPQIQYINREDDMGLENLRKAKLSYAPACMVEKYTATWRESHEDTSQPALG